jgi:hypothetical protein
MFLLMVIYDFNIVRIANFPFKTNAPLIVNANAVLTLPVAFKRFQLIARWLPEVLEVTGTVQIDKLSSCLPFNSLKTKNYPIIKECGRIFAMKCLYHGGIILRVA